MTKEKAVCGAKSKRTGLPCQQPPIRGKKRCRMHGGTNPGRPCKDGRASRYVHIFGPRWAELAADPEILRINAELALFDTFLLERAETLEAGVGREWLDDLRETVLGLEDALFVAKDSGKVRAMMTKLKEISHAGGEKYDAWEDVLTAAKSRAELAVKGEAALARREQSMTEGQMMGLFVRMLEIIVDVCGPEYARRVQSRFEVTVLGAASLPAGDPVS